MKPRPGEVWRFLFRGRTVVKPKFHLCVNEDYRFLLLNTPRLRGHRGDLLISNAEVPFLEPTECGKSAISCTLLIELNMSSFLLERPKLKGTVRRETMQKLVAFLEQTQAITDDERERALDGLYNYYAVAAE